MTRITTVVVFVPWVVSMLGSAVLAQTQQPTRGVPQETIEAPLLLERNPQFESPQFETGRDLPVVRLSWRERDADDVIRDVGAALSVLLGGNGPPSRDVGLREALFGNEEGGWARLADVPHVLVRYDARFDEFRLLNEELDIVREPMGRMSVEEAKERAEQVLRALIERRVVDERLYRDAAVQLGYRRVGGGTTAGPADRGQIVEYRFTYRPRIEGIELANAGVRIGLLTDGAVTSMRVGGVTASGIIGEGGRFEPEEGSGSRQEIEATPGQLMTRFYRSIPPNVTPMIAWSKVMYAMPDDATSALVEPRLLVSFSERQVSRAPNDELRPVVGRRRILGFSLVNAEATPFDFTAPGRGAEAEPVRQR